MNTQAVQELRGSLDFLKDVVVFGAVIFCVLLQLIFTAVDRDLATRRAYEVISHGQFHTSGEVLEAVRELNDPRLFAEDAALFTLQGSPEVEQARRQALERKGLTTEKDLYRRLPAEPTAWRVSQLALFLELYSWVVEITVLLALSQTLQRPHVRLFLYEKLRQARWFLPVTTLLLGGPLLRWASLLSRPDQAAWPGQLMAGSLAILSALLLFWRLRSRLLPGQVTDLGIYILILSLFVKLAGILATPDTAYGFFASGPMQAVRPLSWFVLACGPLVLLEKWVRHARAAPEA